MKSNERPNFEAMANLQAQKAKKNNRRKSGSGCIWLTAFMEQK